MSPPEATAPVADPPGAPEAAPPYNRVLAVLADAGAAGKAVVPGVYAWALTVAPVAWSRGAPLAAKLPAILALVALVATLRRAKGPISLWVFVLSCAVTWVAVPAALSPAHLAATRAFAGTLGWGLFAFAAAAPALRGSREGPAPEAGLAPRQRLGRADAAYVGAGVLMAAALQAVGWTVAVPERATLVRVVTLACGIAVVGATATVAVARHGRHRASVRRGARSAMALLVVLAILLAGGLVYVATR